MLSIRLQRTGRKHETTFRVVLTDSKNSSKSGKFLEVLGSYDPRKETTQIKADRVKHWLSVGAKASGTLHNLLLSQKIITGKKVNVLPKKTVPKKEEVAPVEVVAAPAAAPEVVAPVEVVTPVAVPTPEVVEAPAAQAAPAEETPTV